MRDLWQMEGSGQSCISQARSASARTTSNWPLTYVCTIGLFKAAAAALRRLFNESLYGVCPMGVPEALLTSCERMFSSDLNLTPLVLWVSHFENYLGHTLCRVYSSGLELVAWLW